MFRHLVQLSWIAIAFIISGLAMNEPDLQEGDRAPDFELAGTDGETHSLKEYLGKRPVVIAWFPKAFTGG